MANNSSKIKKYKPTSPARRNMTTLSFDEITKKTPEKALLTVKKKTAGRNSAGRITVRHIGGGNRQKYRIIDFKRRKDNIPATVIGIEYDPNRTANIALIEYEDKVRTYILAPIGLKDGDKVISGENIDIKVGNALPLKNIPVGTIIHNIELNPGQGGKFVKSAGGSGQLVSKEGKYAYIKMPSSELRLVLDTCRATIGRLGNAEHQNVKLGKAGRKRHMGVRPTVRGSAMNPVDHPHGGGEGKSPIGMPSPKTPWGKPTLGYKTRKKHKNTDKYIISRRKKSRRK